MRMKYARRFFKNERNLTRCWSIFANMSGLCEGMDVIQHVNNAFKKIYDVSGKIFIINSVIFIMGKIYDLLFQVLNSIHIRCISTKVKMMKCSCVVIEETILKLQ